MAPMAVSEAYVRYTSYYGMLRYAIFQELVQNLDRQHVYLEQDLRVEDLHVLVLLYSR